MGANVYTATFLNLTVKRTSGRPYDAAWRVVYVSGYDGRTLSETGFSRDLGLATKAADSFISSFANRPRGWRYNTAGFKPGTLVSREVVRTEIVHQIATKAKWTFVAVFADGLVKTVDAAVNYTVAVRVSYLNNPTDGTRTEWTDFGFTQAAAQAKADKAITSHQDFYRNAPAKWADPNFDCQAQVEIVPALTVGEQKIPVVGTDLVLTVNHTAAGQTRLIVTDGGLVKSDETVPSRDYLAAGSLIMNAAQGRVVTPAGSGTVIGRRESALGVVVEVRLDNAAADGPAALFAEADLS